ncbi:MAG TPA: hypothetical protein PLI19_06735 [Erysipelotrichaceae bacterium]|jgi:septal ring-binding cell division protein DamX|nr:hypothetical protein [Erysipelotrichaceae bacterium]HQB33012.1 hypothetical protein [Erysipelotrichaceae bacterium]
MDFIYIITRPGVIMLLVLTVAIIMALFVKPVKKEKDSQSEQTSEIEATPLDLSDEDAVVASLIASIDYYNEIKKDVRVISVRRVG